MAEDSKIEWTTHTFSPWRGCTKVSAGCANCYAETLSGRNPVTLGKWGPNGTRVIAAEATWRDPVKWNRKAAEAGERHRVFCASLADVFEGPETMPAAAWPKVRDARVRLFHLISETPNLDWLLLTKRPENVNRFCVEERSWTESPPPNMWLGTSVENQAAADERIPHLLATPAAVRFLSCEPLLGAVDISRWIGPWRGCDYYRGGCTRPENVFAETMSPASRPGTLSCTPKGCPFGYVGGLHWVIVGGESGPGARSMQIEWARSLVSQCKQAGVACFVKQLGATPLTQLGVNDGHPAYYPVTDKKGGDPDEWPEDLRVREFAKA